MGRSKRALLATAAETSSPPPSLPSGHAIAQVVKAEGTNLYSIWIKRGGYVVVNTSAFDDRDNKLDGEIANIVRNEREWRKYPYWPREFEKKSAYPDDDEEDESVVGKLPPSEDSDSNQ